MTETLRPRPRTRTELFLAFTWMALQGFGGVLAVVQRELVERHQWLTPEEFLEDWSVSQILPGPNVVNLGIIMGNRYFGLSGALVASAGLLLVPFILVLLLVVLYGQVEHIPAIQAALKGMGAVVAGLIIATGLKLIPALRKNPIGHTLGLAWVAISFVVVALLRVPLAVSLLVLGGGACVWAWIQLGRQEQQP
ncbi:MAG: chromate transporter [Limnohabitans sp.]|jgi:chromate transporter|nr:chromate transporter [Limnohabitans sp.]